MNSKKMLMLVVAAVVLVGLAYWSARKRDTGRVLARRVGAPVLPALQNVDMVNRIARMTFVSPGSTVDVARVDGAWTAPAKHGYPVKFQNVREFVLTLVNLKAGQPLSVNESRRQRLGLLAPTDAPHDDDASFGTKVVLADERGATLAELIVGNEFLAPEDTDSPMPRQGGMPQGRYVAAGDMATVVTEQFHSLPRKEQDWLDDDLVHVAASDIARIEMKHPDRERLVLRRPEAGGSLTLSNLDDREEINTSKLGGVSGILGYLRFSDIADPALSDEAMGLDRPSVFTAETRDGARYVLTIGDKADVTDDRYVRLSAAWIGSEPSEPARDKASDEASDDADDDTADGADDDAEATAEKDRQAREKKRAEIDELNARWSAWTYILPSYKIHHALVAREDLVQEKKAESKDEADKVGPDDGDSEKKPGFLKRLFGKG